MPVGQIPRREERNTSSPKRPISRKVGLTAEIDFETGSLDLEVLNVLIIPDKFKGTLSARSAAEAIGRGWLQTRPTDTLSLLPMSDGGDGFGQVMGELLGAEKRGVEGQDAAHRPCTSHWWWEPKSKTALIDSAGVIGLAMLPPRRFHPFELDTYGLGLVLKAAAGAGIERCMLGIGGSATNDGGFGMARALGWRFVDETGRVLERWTELVLLHHVEHPQQQVVFSATRVAVDVQNPLLGPQGATRIYGPQKGLKTEEFPIAERCLEALARVMDKESRTDYASMPGAGAAGGLGFGCLAFLQAQLEPGFELFASEAKLIARLKATDLVVTGEGAIDHSTLMGKGVGRVGECCRELGIPCVALGGQVILGKDQNLFRHTAALTELTSLEDAKSRPDFWLQQLARLTAERFKSAS